MLDLSTVADSLLDPVAQVVAGLQEQEPQLEADSIMLVGAWCRDALHAALGHIFSTSATRDVDLALALDEWGTCERLSRVLPRAGDSGVRFRVAGFVVDLLPFRDVEDPRGPIVPPSRAEGMSVWAFAEIFAGASPLVRTPSRSIRCPTVPGYAAAKLAAWLDRSEWGEVKAPTTWQRTGTRDPVLSRVVSMTCPTSSASWWTRRSTWRAPRLTCWAET